MHPNVSRLSISEAIEHELQGGPLPVTNRVLYKSTCRDEITPVAIFLIFGHLRGAHFSGVFGAHLSYLTTLGILVAQVVQIRIAVDLRHQKWWTNK